MGDDGLSANDLDKAPFGFEESEGSIADFRDLEVWKIGMKLAAAVYRATARFPRAELYGLTSQMRRASVSIPSNVAEGYGRHSSGSYIQFLKIALGSAKELETLVELSAELGFLDSEPMQELKSAVQRVSRMLYGLIRAIEARRR
ncbi:MAG: four helix bundle protein [Parvularculaceae bacterium]